MDASVLILYGTQTGNAQDVAERLAREATLLLFRPSVLSMDAYDVTGLPSEPLVVCVVSTTGQGDPPDSMRTFWRFLLRKSLPADSLAATRFAVFGLGDSSYPLFNVTAKKLHRRLEALGGRPLLDVGLGDDQAGTGYEAVLDQWAPQLWECLRKAAGPLPPGTPQPVLGASTVLEVGEPKYVVTPVSGDSERGQLQGNGLAGRPHEADEAGEGGGSLSPDSWAAAIAARAAFQRVALAAAAGPPRGTNRPAGDAEAPGAGFGPDRPFFAGLRANRRITAPAHFQDTRHIEFDLTGSGITYEPGDVLGILPQQQPGLVDGLIRHLGLQGEQLVEVRPHGGGQQGAACVATVRALIQGSLDVTSASPRRFFFQVLARFAQADMERERLLYFASAAGRDDVYRYCHREGRSVFDVLRDFPSAQLPLAWLLQACPTLQPRLFSIASSHRLHPGQAHITVALVDYKTPYGRRKRGLCSSYLASLSESLGAGGTNMAAVTVWVQRGAMRMPPSLSTPLILVGPGTGVAPFRAFLQERLALLRAGTPAAGLAPCHLFFGCRDATMDFYYEHEWLELREAGILASTPTGLVTACSRPISTGAKAYVTHKLREHGEALWRLLQAGAAVYVCGSAKRMPADVQAAFQDIAQEHGGLTKDAAAALVRQLQLTGRYCVEAWA